MAMQLNYGKQTSARKGMSSDAWDNITVQRVMWTLLLVPTGSHDVTGEAKPGEPQRCSLTQAALHHQPHEHLMRLSLCASLHSEVLVRSWGIHGPVLHPCVRGLLHHSLHKATGSSAQTRRAANARLEDLWQRQPHGHQATAGQQLQQHIWKT